MTTPPGWYDDPTMANTRRYWDGQQWTEHRQERPASSTGKSGGPFWKWVAVIVVAIVLAVAALRLLYGEGIIGGATTYDSSELAADIASGLEDRGVKGADLTCTGPSSVHQGDVVICSGSDQKGEDVSVEVTFNSDGSYVWRQQ